MITGRDDERDLERLSWSDFFRSAFREANQTVYQGRVARGPFYTEINQALGGINEEIAKVSPELTPECFFPASYRSREVSATINKVYRAALWRDYENDSRNFRVKREHSISQAIKPKAKETLAQTIPAGLLDQPDYRCMSTGRDCVTTSFMMIMDAITNGTADDTDIHRIIQWEYRDDVIHDEEYIKLLQSRVFQQRFGKTVQAASFVGADFAMIAKLAERLREGNPDRKIFGVVNLLSDTTYMTRVNGIWHSAVLLNVTDDYVTIHEPTVNGYGEELRIPKDKFLFRWSQGLLRGHLIIAE
ncbi:MAG: hypothetical protein ABIQ89_03705 [Candidatus Saccharimonadales bacterium]